MGKKGIGRGRGFRPDDAERARLAGVRKMALELRLGGATYDQIAARCKYASSGAAHNAVQRELKAIPKEAARNMREMEGERLDAMMLSVWRRALRGDHAAISQVLEIMRTRSKLFGLNVEAEGQPAVVVQKAFISIDLEQL